MLELAAESVFLDLGRHSTMSSWSRFSNTTGPYLWHVCPWAFLGSSRSRTEDLRGSFAYRWGGIWNVNKAYLWLPGHPTWIISFFTCRSTSYDYLLISRRHLLTFCTFNCRHHGRFRSCICTYFGSAIMGFIWNWNSLDIIQGVRSSHIQMSRQLSEDQLCSQPQIRDYRSWDWRLPHDSSRSKYLFSHTKSY